MSSTVRTRLTSWYVGVLGAVLIAFSVGAYLLVARSLYDRLDTRLAATLQTITTALKRPLTEQGSNDPAIGRALEELRVSSSSRVSETIAVLDATGRVIAQRTIPGGLALRLPPRFNPSDTVEFYELAESYSDADDSCRGAFQRFTNPATGNSYVAVVMQSLEPLEEQLESLQDTLYIAVPLTLILAGLGGWFLARRSLSPVLAMSERAQRISVENLDQRLPIVNPRDELGRLAATFNELLARLSASFAQQRQFMADASHELRTPLSAIRTAASVMLQRENRDQSEYREAFAIVEQEALRLTRIVEDMFVLARADAGHPVLQHTNFYLDELLAESVRAAAVLASQNKIQVEIVSSPEAPFSGDEGLLRQMMWNLLDNAIKNTPQGGSVRIALESRGEDYVITVTDTGSGIAPEVQSRIFERFYRVDKARTRTEGSHVSGAGLGLPLARWIAEAHHGQLDLQRSDLTGSTFAVFLPRTHVSSAVDNVSPGQS